ncbi:MAG: TonB family protein [Cryomorphaceae bacterium]|nr:energy transducer TonB [Flavobacteriales bacterium]
MSKPKPAYGAESLEARYPMSALTSLGFALAVVLLAALYPYIRHVLRKPAEEKIQNTVTKVVNYSELQAPPPIELERRLPEPVDAVPKAKAVKFLQPVAKKDEEVPEDKAVPTRDEMSDALIGTQDVEGTDSIFVEQPDVEIRSEPEPEAAPPEVFDFVEVMPEFVGGQQAFQDYLARNLRYPGIAREAGIQGTVFVAFVVEADGRITEVQVVRSVHPILDEEAVRVISQMPPWQPGLQHQSPVRVRFTLPVGFRLV